MTIGERELLLAIDDERRRLGLPTVAVRIGCSNGRVWAATSRHMDSAFREGLHTGDTVSEALSALLAAYKSTGEVAP